MKNKSINIIKNYFSLVGYKDFGLYVFTLICLINVLIGLIKPYYEASTITLLTTASYTFVFKNLAIITLILIINRALSFITNTLYAKYFKKIYARVHQMLVKSVCEFDENYGREINNGKILNSSNQDILNMAEIPSIVFEMMIEIIKLVILFTIFFSKSKLVFVYVFVVFLIYYIFAKWCIVKSNSYLKKQRKYADELTSLLSQLLRGLKDVKSLGLYSKLENKMKKLRIKWGNSYYQKRRYLIIRKNVVSLFIDIAKFGMLFILIYFLINNKMELTIVLLLISYYGRIRETLDNIISFYISLAEKCVSFERVKDIIDHKNYTCYIDNIHKKNVTGVIEFKNVSFKYDDKLVLKHVSFKIPENSLITLVGEYGSGKTTIFNLLLRFYNIDTGNILIDNLDIYKYSKEKYSSIISVVNQNTFMFDFSIKDNLSVGNSSFKDQVNVCKKVGIHDHIMSLKDGYNTVLKENADNLSGGQKQLLSLARVMLINPKIILLDEVTSSLDPKTSRKIFELINELKGSHTILIITHNKKIMELSDNLILLEKGKIMGVGNHELLMNNKAYKNLVDNVN